MKELRQLTKTVINPNHDKRRRYGEDARAEFKNGGKFVYETSQDWLGQRVCFILNSGKTLYVSRELEREFLENSEVIQPICWHDVQALFGGYEEDVLDYLIKSKKISIDELKNIISDLDAKAAEMEQK